MKCPNCPEINLLISERQGIEVDYCPECRGIWLDRGELDKIIEHSTATSSGPPPGIPMYAYDRHQHGHHDEHHGEHRRKRNWLREVLD